MTVKNQIFDSIFLLDVKGIELNNQKTEFPFKIALSFEKLIEHIENVAATGDNIQKSFAQSILDEIKKIPELQGSIHDNGIIKKHEKIISDMMMFVFPNAFWDKQTYAAAHPYFTETPFYASPRYNEIIKMVDGNIDGELNIDMASYNFGRTVSGFAAILGKFYNLNLRFDFPLVYKIPDPETGLDRYFKLNLAKEFMDISALKELKPLSQKDLENIETNIYDVDYLKKMIPPENFEFRGFLVINLINITDTEILSAMKRYLIEKDTITTYSGFLKLQHSLRSLLRCPELLLGLTDCQGCLETTFLTGNKYASCFLASCGCDINASTVKDSIYEYSFESRKVVIIEDIMNLPNRTIIEKKILEKGIRNILVAPLIYGDEIVGILELASPNPGSINKMNALNLREVLPIFAMAVARSKDETDNKIQAIIKEKCTAIHPSLEWRFRNAAFNLMQKEQKGIQEEIEEIVFHDVYPLYGLSDIRNSSLQRNNAIKDDLIENLKLAQDVIDAAKNHKPLHAFDELNYKIVKRMDALKFSIGSGDESQTLLFLNKQITPLFEYIQSYSLEIKKIVEKYNTSLDKKLGFVYKRRKEFEESATKLSDMIANYIDDEQVKIQKVFPHYFERYKSDGVDHNIYIGSSLVENGKFDKVYLRNIRLWQLMLVCGIIRNSVEFKKQIKLPLETAHLILVQSSPLSIRFRFDEKKFDIDGAYNVRYEIMKKRIDKAEIKGKEERLTQPGKIAIVYSQNSESQEYLEYLEYLQANDFLKNEIEELDLEELQGVKGLRALRVSVNTENKNTDTAINNEDIKVAVENMNLN